jgi:hypothetical protein
VSSLPDSYTVKPNAIADYFDAMLHAQPPDRFSVRFLEGLGFKSTNDRLIVGVLKDLGFLDSDAKPTDRYYRYLDREQSARVLAEGIREAYTDLFAVRTNANELPADEVRDKLRTLYAGRKTDNLIGRIATTFAALCELADFSESPPAHPIQPPAPLQPPAPSQPPVLPVAEPIVKTETTLKKDVLEHPVEKPIGFRSLQYHINIVLPESRDQSVYDAIFKSLKDHLG